MVAVCSIASLARKRSGLIKDNPPRLHHSLKEKCKGRIAVSPFPPTVLCPNARNIFVLYTEIATTVYGQCF